MNANLLVVNYHRTKADYFGLYDYESQASNSKGLKISTSGFLVKKSSDLTFQACHTPQKSSLFKVIKLRNEFFICPVASENIGLVLNLQKFSAAKGYKLKEGDTLKLGKIFFKVKEIGKEGPMLEEKVTAEAVEQREELCRICFEKEISISNPLISLCKCVGSLKFTHLECLQRWVMSQSYKRITTSCHTYAWTSFFCEICTKKLPLTIQHKGTEYSLIKIPRPYGNYIMLEDMRREKYCYTVHILVTISQSPLFIGSGINNDLKISDPTISKTHSLLLCRNGFYLKDLDSRYGTSIIIKNPILLNKSDKFYAQAEDVLIEFSVCAKMKTWPDALF